MSTPTIPHVRLMDQDDLELSFSKDENKASLGSLRHLEDIDALLPHSIDEEKQPPSSGSNGTKALLWMIANVIASIAFVLLNKSLFAPATFQNAQLSFAAFHFAVASTTLYTLSRPRFALFEAKRAPLFEMLPLALVLCGAVILSNFSLAYASVPFYQTVRGLLVLIVTAMNLILRIPQLTLPRMALVSLLPACIGVGIVTHYQYHAVGKKKDEKAVGITAAFLGVLVSACYTTSTDLFQRRFQIDDLQLAFNQTSLAGFALLYIVPWVDTFPVWGELPLSTWATLLMSGACTCIITISQAHVAAEAGVVSKTVAGHVTAVSVVAISWISGGSGLPTESIFGLVMAVGGILAYSSIMLKNEPK